MNMIFVPQYIDSSALQDYDGSIHAVIDGWTAPFVASYLGIVIIWFSAGKIHRAILELIR